MRRRGHLLVPVTVDPGGRIGPLAERLLMPPNQTYPAPSPSAQRPTTALSLLAARQFCQDTQTHSPTALFAQADQGWRNVHGDRPFHDNADTPSQWARNLLALNITLANTLHLQRALSHTQPFDSRSTKRPITAAGTTPRPRAPYPTAIPAHHTRPKAATWPP